MEKRSSLDRKKGSVSVKKQALYSFDKSEMYLRQSFFFACYQLCHLFISGEKARKNQKRRNQ